MFLEKDGIRVEVVSATEAARLKSLGYHEVIEAVEVEPPAAEDADEAEETADENDASKRGRSKSKASE